MRIKYRHLINYSYPEPVLLGEHRLCIKPRSHGFQNLINFKINIEPIPNFHYSLISASGEEILKTSFEGYTDNLSIEAISEVETFEHPSLNKC